MTVLFEEEDGEDDVSVDELLENTDLITQLMDELREVAPAAGEVLIDERDEFPCQQYPEASSEREGIGRDWSWTFGRCCQSSS